MQSFRDMYVLSPTYAQHTPLKSSLRFPRIFALLAKRMPHHTYLTLSHPSSRYVRFRCRSMVLTPPPEKRVHVARLDLDGETHKKVPDMEASPSCGGHWGMSACRTISCSNSERPKFILRVQSNCSIVAYMVLIVDENYLHSAGNGLGGAPLNWNAVEFHTSSGTPSLQF